MEIKLSTDSDALICVLYAEYLNRREHGVPIEDAACFSDDYAIQRDFLPDWLPEDVITVCGWLMDKGLIYGCPGDDHWSNIQLTEDGIIYMESRFSRRRESVLNHLRDLVALGISIAGLLT